MRDREGGEQREDPEIHRCAGGSRNQVRLTAMTGRAVYRGCPPVPPPVLSKSLSGKAGEQLEDPDDGRCAGEHPDQVELETPGGRAIAAARLLVACLGSWAVLGSNQ